MNQDQAIASYKPPIFWKEKDIIKKQLNILSIDDKKSFIKQVNNLELLIKKTQIYLIKLQITLYLKQ